MLLDTVRSGWTGRRFLMMFLVVVFIFVDILCGNFIGIISDSQPRMIPTFLFLGFGLLQIACAPFQSGLSDRIGRKKSLIISLSFSLLSLLAILLFQGVAPYFFFLVLALFLKGALGNTLPISLAVMADVQDKNYRISFAFSTAAYALAYLLLATVLGNISDAKINYLLIIIFAASILFCIKAINDAKDKNKEVEHTINAKSITTSIQNESLLISRDLRLKSTRKALLAFFFWELSLYSILLTQIDFHVNRINHIAQSMMYGYLLGVLTLFFCNKIKDKSIIRMGYIISFISLIPYFILFKLVADENSLIKTCYFFHALGNAFLSPALLSILAKERKVHERGRIYGLTDSVDTCGYLLASLVILSCNYAKIGDFYLILFSFLTFAFSWRYYSRFANVERAE